MVPGLCDTICRKVNESKRLTPVHGRSIYRFEHIRANGSDKVVTKWDRDGTELGVDLLADLSANTRFHTQVGQRTRVILTDKPSAVPSNTRRENFLFGR
jgi:hypothetical protein